MGGKKFCIVGGMLAIVGLVLAQEDSLRSALTAIESRQRDLSLYSPYKDDFLGEYGYSFEGSDDLDFFSPKFNEKDLEKKQLLTNYLEDNSYIEPGQTDHENKIRKKNSSLFRERLEEDKKQQLEDLAQDLFINSENNKIIDNDSYNQRIKEMLQKYQHYSNFYNRPRLYMNSDIKKRFYYPQWGLDSIGLKKRDKFHKDYYNFYQDENDAEIDSNFYDWNKNKLRKQKDLDIRQKFYTAKRFPVSKRSSNYELVESKFEQKHMKKGLITKTDPEVAKDLSNVFGITTTKSPITTTKRTTTIASKKVKKNKSNLIKYKQNKQSISKEEFKSVTINKPLEITKKNINWSDYFGIDRRKKSRDDLDKEWLMKRYHQAVALTNKRVAEYPLQSFKNHDQAVKKITETNIKDSATNEEIKIAEMDAKLKNMEDTIIDDALKYTGSHEGTSDSQEIQDVKDRVISRMAAAYSLEKMRRALGEYRLSIAKGREKLKHLSKNKDYEISEDKRASVPRKQAVDEERKHISKADNNIKCSQSDENCSEQNYKMPSDVLEQLAYEPCPAIQKACREFADALDHYAEVFEAACNMHQMCWLCSTTWLPPVRQCRTLFLAKAYELCAGKEECHELAQGSFKYLENLNRSMRSQPLNDCDLICSDRR